MDIKKWINTLSEGFYDEYNDISNLSGEKRLWILPDGLEIHLRRDLTHSQVAYNLLHNFDDNVDVNDPFQETEDRLNAYNKAINDGWIRVAITSNNSDFISYFNSNSLTKDSIRTLEKLMNDNIVYNYSVESFPQHNSKNFDNPKEALNYIHRMK